MPKSKTYDEFIEKFKPKKTTDDCYTPENIYNCVAEWGAKTYHVDRSTFVRPFYVGGDYQNEEYHGKIVVDNPPFSILAEIVKFYQAHQVKFLLFVPTLTSIRLSEYDCTFLAVGIALRFENGAKVNISFLTNLEPSDIQMRTVPDLTAQLQEVNALNEKQAKKKLPKYQYPCEVMTAGRLHQFSLYGFSLAIPRSACKKISKLETSGSIFGDGYLLSRKQAEKVCSLLEKQERERIQKERERIQKERERTIVFQLTEQEKEICENLDSD